MNSKDRILVLFIAIALSLCLIPSAMASTEEQQTNLTKDAAQLKIEALEAELGEEGMKKVADYLELQASLPDAVKRMPFRGLAFAATDPESQAIKMEYIDNFNVSETEKEKYKAGLQDIWDRYPDKITKDDYAFMSELGPMIDEEALREHPVVRIMWSPGKCHPDFAYYACDGSAYRSYARNTTDDPDNSGFDRCNEFANSAISAKNNRDQATAHQNFRYSSHYLSDSLPHLQLLTQILIEKESNGQKYRNLII